MVRSRLFVLVWPVCVTAMLWCVPDPLCWHGATRARVAHEYLLAAEAGLKAMYTHNFPFIVYHGADDTLTDPDGSKKLYERSVVNPPCIPTLLLTHEGPCHVFGP